MVILTPFTIFGLMGSSLAVSTHRGRQTHSHGALPPPDSSSSNSSGYGCGEVNIFYTGFAAYHPYVIAQHLPEDSAHVSFRLRNNTAQIVEAGYNLRVVFQGPEQPMSNFAERLKGTDWTAIGQGMGVRAYSNATATETFEDRLDTFRRYAPEAFHIFNWSPNTFLDSVKRRYPLKEDCTNKPGKLLGYEEICAPDVCEKVTVILDGDLSKLLAPPSE